MRSGTYRGISDDLVVEIRIELNSSGAPAAMSGDVNLGPQFIASFFASAPTLEGRKAAGRVQFRGNPRLFTGSVELDVDERGLGVFQLGVDVEGGHRDIIAGRAEWVGSAMRRLTIEVDGVRAMPFFDSYSNRVSQTVSIKSAFASAGFDVRVIVDPFATSVSRDNERRGFTHAEIHRAMTTLRNAPATGRMQVHVFVATYMAGKNGRGVLGVMYDFGADDLNRKPREGVAVFGRHPMLSDPRIPLNDRRREFVYTIVHETGHALNLLHSFDKGRPASLSWMNYPHLYPLGGEAGGDHDGTGEFWNAFGEAFDELELLHLRHATPREIASGGLPFGVYEEGPSSLYQGGTANPRLTQLGSNPLRQTPNLNIAVTAPKRHYHLGEPVFVELAVAGRDRAVRIPDALDPSEGFTRFVIERPDGTRERYAPPMRLCLRAPSRTLTPGTESQRSHPIPLFLGASGPVFRTPGRYRIWAELAGVDGSRVAFADPYDLTVVAPDLETQMFAETLWSTPGAMQALYLRHPLTNRRAWKELEEAAARTAIGKKSGNTTKAYIDFLSALGWSRPFQYTDRNDAQPDAEKMKSRLDGIDAAGLPESVQSRIQAMKEEAEAPRPTRVMGASFEETLRDAIPANGLFGEVGLDQPMRPPAGPVSPFLVLPALKDNPAFADIVSWNIQHLHGEIATASRIRKLAEYMEAFRCDFWGLQEVEGAAVAKLVAAINARGNLVYDFFAIKGAGQQSACIFRTDTTRVKVLDPDPASLFEGKISVVKSGKKTTARVFPRDPLLCNVSVRQSTGKVFDFRCAIVHTKSTDPDLKDKGVGMRQAASKTLEGWVTDGLKKGGERDFLVMGDMNAEEANEGLAAFANSKKMKLLSIGMKKKHGTKGPGGAITRFASGRLLDHIAITSDTVALMPKSDEDEQIIIRSDISVEGFTKPVKGSAGPFQQFEFSDHVPVAVRIILGKDAD